MFGFIVAAYFFSVVGLPVYIHYCGGEVEKISYLIKANDCCGEEDENADSDCCHNADCYVQNTTAFSLKLISYQVFNNFVTWFALPHFTNTFCFLPVTDSENSETQFPPPKLQLKQLISVSVIRI